MHRAGVRASLGAKAQIARRVGVMFFGVPGTGCVEWATLSGSRAVSTDDAKPGGKMLAEDLVTEGKALIEAGRQREAQQLSLLGPPAPETMQRVREELGPLAGEMTVLAEARKRGRPKGALNRRTKDFREYMLRFGRHPALTLMEIQNTAPEILVERSRMLDTPKRQLSYGDAQQLRMRAAEALMPFMESKQPVAIELSADGDFNLIIPGVNLSEADATAAAAGEFVLEADFDEVEDLDHTEGGE